MILFGTRLDGGAASPLDALLLLTLTYMAVAYPPYGVVAMGTLMTGGYVALFATSGVTTSAAFFIAVMVAFTLICTMASANSCAANDRQAPLITTQRTLAATDPPHRHPEPQDAARAPLPGGPRRRPGAPVGRLPG